MKMPYTRSGPKQSSMAMKYHLLLFSMVYNDLKTGIGSWRGQITSRILKAIHDEFMEQHDTVVCH